MFDIVYRSQKQRRKVFRVSGTECLVGRSRSCDLLLSSRSVNQKHLTFIQHANGIHLQDLGSSTGTYVNHQRVVDYGPIDALDEVSIGEYRLEVKQLTAIQTADLQTDGASSHSTGQTSSTIDVSTQSPVQSSGSAETVVAQSYNLEFAYWGRVVHERLLEAMDLRRKDVSRMSDSQLRAESGTFIKEIIQSLVSELPSSVNQEHLYRHVLNESVGLGPLEAFLEDDTISEVMVNNHEEIYVEKHGRLERSNVQFSSEKTVYSVIERIITPLGRRIDESSPIVDARLKDGSRVNAIIPPLSLKGPALTIRKFPKHQLSFQALIESESLSGDMVEFLKHCVEQRRNIVVAGGTGSGKTTLLNLLSGFIPHSQRIVTIEDAAELKLEQPNWVALEARPSNSEGTGQVTIRDLMRNALRMRPDRIVVGECRGGEAIDMLQAMNTGHNGSLTTVHANTPRDVVSRLEVLVLMSGIDIPIAAIREQIASAVDIIIQQNRMACGTRKVTQISEVVGVESGTIQLQDIFRFTTHGHDSDGRTLGQFETGGFIPTFYEHLRRQGVSLPIEAFTPSTHAVRP